MPCTSDTIFGGPTQDEYLLLCQKLSKQQKKHLILMVLGIPDRLHGLSLSNKLSLLKKHCSAIFAQMPLDSNYDFMSLQDLGFDAIGTKIGTIKNTQEIDAIKKIESFLNRVKQKSTDKSFILDVPSLSITTSAICSGCTYLGGSEIHAPVNSPDNNLVYQHEGLLFSVIK